MTATPAPRSTRTGVGLYTSWCQVTRNPPRTERSFWTAMKNRLGTGSIGLCMTGPAAADYILASYLGLV